MKILADPTIPLIKSAFPEPFEVQFWSSFEQLQSLLPEQDMLLCRSTLKVNESLLKNSRLKYLATASSGTDHIDHAALAARQITLLDARGSNAHSVADYVLAVLSTVNRLGISVGRKAGIIGCGAVGSMISRRLQMAGFELVIFDPPRAAVDATFKSAMLSDLLDCDILCVHAALHENHPWPSKNLLDHDFLSKLKSGVLIINAARGGIVNEKALLDIRFPIHYCTDVYSNEPDINPAILDFATICTPHIAGHSLEAKENATMLISQNLHAYLGWTPPVPNPKKSVKPALNLHSDHWQDIILDFYDPLKETHILKQSMGDRNAFIALRSQHQRHDIQIG